MKNFFEKILTALPYAILIILVGFLFIFVYKNNLNYQQFIGILQILIWPTVVLVALIFFKKVFTYLFLSMDEFNFFGTRGNLKDVREVIDERVNARLTEQKEQEKVTAELTRLKKDFDDAKSSKDSSDQRANENLALAKQLLAKYEDVSNKYSDAVTELTDLRRQQEERRARMAALRERMKRAPSPSGSQGNELVGADVPKADKPKS